MRSKYIRFFISSTFADMVKERDLLQKIFARLSDEYAQKDWQIEAVDLRWGISQEAGFDNRTIQICKSEIKRCQQLSPRPNFIALIGNRYGWIPLPETIPFKVGMSLKMSTTERELFGKWYRLDENALPDGEYILQRREGNYRDNVIWFDDVEYPLSKMFIRNAERIKWKLWEFRHQSKSAISRLFGESATAQEIHLGAFDIPGSKEHVIAYLRDLTNIPDSDISIFCENGKHTTQRLNNLKKQLETSLDSNNILKIKEPFSQYASTHFSNMFTLEMEKRIRQVIDKAISEYEATAATTEDEIHLDIAAEEARNFVGRTKELADISQYINDPNEHRPLWIKSESGSGKSALMAKVIQNHLHTHRIICRFCGRSSGALTTEDLSFIAKSWKQKDFLKTLTEPTLIILDALNQLDDKNDLQFASLNWLKEELPPNIKIIISTTNELKYSQAPEFLKIYELSNMGEDSEALVMNVLKQFERRLTPDQKIALHKIIEVSNHSALYLHILGHYLRHATSWDYIDDTPSNLEGLIYVMIGELTQPERHGAPLVIGALSFMIIDKMGITDKEMIDLLSENNHVRKALESNSFHPLDTQELGWKIPSVLWSRLRYDLSPFLRTYTSQAGQMTTIYHYELKQILFNLCLNKPIFVAETASHLFHYYKSHIHTNNTHALLEIIHSTIDYNTIERGHPYIDEVANFLCSDLDFLLTKHRLFPQQLIDDFNIILPYFDGEKRNKIAALKRSISSLPKDACNEQLLLYMHGLPTDSILHQLALRKVDKAHVMKNLLADTGLEDSTIYAMSEIGELPCMSDDGSKVASLFENRRNIRIADLIHPEKTISLNATAEVLELQCDDEMKYLAIRTDNTCLVFDLEHSNTIFSHYIGERGWMSISADGQTFALGDIGMAQVFTVDSDKDFNKIFNCNFPKNEGMCGRIDPTGQYLWILFKNCFIGLVNLNTRNFIGEWFLSFSKRAGRSIAEDMTIGGKTIDELYDPLTFIPSCTKDVCICYHDQYLLIAYINHTTNTLIAGGHTFWFSSYLGNKPLIAISRDGQYLLTLGGKFQYAYCHIDKINFECDEPEYVGHCYIWDLICVNSNFSIGLCTDKKRVINLPIQLKYYEEVNDGWGGLNSISCSSDGNYALISYGKNTGMERKKEVIWFSPLGYQQWPPPFDYNNYFFVSSSKLSANGELMAVGNCTHNSGLAEILIYNALQRTIIARYQEEKTQCKNINISKDSHYIIATFDDNWSRNHEAKISVIGKNGNMIYKFSVPDLYYIHERTAISNNNRYLIFWSSVGISGGSKILDLVSCKIVNSQPLNMNYLYSLYGYSTNHFWGIDLYQNILYNDKESRKFCKYSLLKDSIVSYDWDMSFIGISPSGRILFFIDKDDTLYKSTIPLKKQFDPLLKHVKWIVTTFDENHIFAITNNGSILLYNIKNKRIEQKSYCGELCLVQVCCAKGLYATNVQGRTFLFQPDDKFHVNVPAITTFVRRWNLETKEQEEPSAVCPMCGHQFGLPEEMASVITDVPSEINYADWDNPQLKGHFCPHCGAQLQFNPYIT